jgi:hypothetical protein
MTLDELKQQRRWVLWRLETVHGKQTKVPYQPSGRKAMANNPGTWHAYADCAALASQFSGVGLVLGDGVWGVDIDGCCDAVSGKFTPESRLIVIGLDSYGEYSPSGTGCHVLGLGKLPGPGLKKPHPGCKAVEVKSDGYYFTFTGRHLSKTPAALEDRQEQVLSLYDRVSKIATPRNTGLTVSIPLSEEERFRKLMAGDMSDYNGDHSTADFALCILLAKKHGCNAFKIDAEFRESGLYREKWERDDYRESTITRAVTAVAKDAPVIFADPEDEPIEDDGVTEYLVDALPEPMHEGWFPKGEVSLIGGSSGAGKTSWAMPLLERIRKGADVFGHSSKPRDYRVLLHDRSKKAMQRTVRSLGLSTEAIQRVIRLSTTQQSRPPAEILESIVEGEPGVECWFIEGLDLWIKDPNKMEVVGPVIDGLQRIATRRNVAVLGTVGSPKQRGKDNKYYGRDSLFGSAALARKVETVVLPMNGRAETLFFEWQTEGLCLTTEPQAVPELKAIDRMEERIFNAVQPGGEIKFQPGFGNRNLFFAWKDKAMKQGKVTRSNGKYYRAFPGAETVN